MVSYLLVNLFGVQRSYMLIETKKKVIDNFVTLTGLVAMATVDQGSVTMTTVARNIILESRVIIFVIFQGE